MGRKQTEATKEKMRGRKFTQIHRDRISAARRGVSSACSKGCHCGRHIVSKETGDRISKIALLRGGCLDGCSCRRHISRAPLSTLTRHRMAIGQAKSYANGTRKSMTKSGTWMEIALSRLLTGAGFEFEEQTRFGRYVVDAWLPDERLVFEADGSYWHQDKEKESFRDAYIMDRGVLAVVHLTEHDLWRLRL